MSMLFFADDGLILADDVQTLRRAFEAMWIVARVAGLRLQVKGKKKTAWSATYWESDGTERDVTGWEMVMPDGSTIPQLEGDDKYKYLGTELTTGWNRGEAQAAVRKKVVAKCRQAIGLIARIPLLSEEQLAKAIELAMAGIIGYYGRSTVITWEDAVQIENARGEALRAKGFTTGLPKATLYANRGSGLEHTHAYAMAAAALCDQVERALQGGEGVAARAVVEAELANTCARLGCRDVNPLEWHPTHLMEGPDQLREDVIMEAYLKARVRLGMRGRLTQGGRKLEGPLAEARWIMTERQRREAGPLLWEDTNSGPWQGTKGCTYSRRLAAAGIATWEDVLDEHTRELKTWAQIREEWGFKASAQKAKLEYDHLKGEMRAQQDVSAAMRTTAGRQPVQATRPGENAGVTKENWGEGAWAMSEVMAARKAPTCFGGWEYRIRWEGGYEDTWEKATHMRNTKDMKEMLDEARQNKLVHTSYREWLECTKKKRTKKGRTALEAHRKLGNLGKEGDGEGEWDAVWQTFKEYAEEAMKWSSAEVNLGEASRAPRGATWAVNEECTCYPGVRRQIESIDKQGQKITKEGAGAGLQCEEAGVRVQPGEAMKRVAIEKEHREEARRNQRGEYDSVLPATFPLHAMDLEGEGTFEGCSGTGAGFEYIADKQIEADPVARLFGRCQSFEGGGEVHTMSGRGVTLDKGGREVLRGIGERSRKESGEAMRVAMDLHAAVWFTHAFATDGSKHRDGRTAYGIWSGARLREQGGYEEEGLRMLQAEPGMEERATRDGEWKGV